MPPGVPVGIAIAGTVAVVRLLSAPAAATPIPVPTTAATAPPVITINILRFTANLLVLVVPRGSPGGG
jgi:hypothetical protein